MTDVVSEVQEDGSTTISGTAHKSNYDMELNRLDGILPEIPPMDALSKLFKPRYVLKVTTPDGIEIPFVYKRIDPGTLMMMQGSPLAVDIGQAQQRSTELVNQMEALREKVNAEDVDPEAISEEIRKLRDSEETQELFNTARDLRKRTVQAGVIQPEITDELYANLDDDILQALYQAITGGVTNSNEMVEHFRELANESKVS